MKQLERITLAAARVNAKLTQKDVAKALGVTQNTVYRWETGITPIKAKYLFDLAKLYDMSIEQFFLE